MKLTAKRLILGVRSRLMRRAKIFVLAAHSGVPGVPEMEVLRVGADSSDLLRSRVEQAMCHADEPSGLAAKRFAHGDQFFGWTREDRIVSFGWTMSQDRVIHGLRMREMSARVFLYNFYTEASDRGRGLYPRLLGVICQQLAHEGATEFIIDVESRNKASLRGVSKAGFVIVAHAQFVVVCNHWYVLCSRSADAGLDLALFFT